MKKVIQISVVLMFTVVMNAQSDKFQFRSVSLGLGICYGPNNDGGPNFTFDLATALNSKHLLSANINAGEEFNLFDAKRSFTEYNILYGRDFEIDKRLNIEVHGGLGLFSRLYRDDTTEFQDKKDKTLGIPLRAKLLYYVIKDELALGFNQTININSLDKTFTTNLVLQYVFKK
ncbi:hypothetical protein [Flavobacterium terrisoli]|uniref:hypothetical protein n=1 Tax=Flavobacterium terrisoli TaxID=3242195 RepID=UPI0025439E35|nr:hypothetical protein [Flavobacterium buctense]